MKHYEGRYSDLKKRVNQHLQKLTGQNVDFFSKFKQSDFVELKTVLADINNVLTFKITMEAAAWLCAYFKFDNDVKAEILETIDRTKPNTTGFDIHITEPQKILAEVKCTSPVNSGGKFGAAQSNSILDDFFKLKYGKGTLLDTSEYYKFVFLIDLGERTDQAISQLIKISKGTSDIQLRVNRHKIKEHILLLTNEVKLNELDIEKVYLKKLLMD